MWFRSVTPPDRSWAAQGHAVQQRGNGKRTAKCKKKRASPEGGRERGTSHHGAKERRFFLTPASFLLAREAAELFRLARRRKWPFVHGVQETLPQMRAAPSPHLPQEESASTDGAGIRHANVRLAGRGVRRQNLHLQKRVRATKASERRRNIDGLMAGTLPSLSPPCTLSGSRYLLPPYRIHARSAKRASTPIMEMLPSSSSA